MYAKTILMENFVAVMIMEHTLYSNSPPMASYHELIRVHLMTFVNKGTTNETLTSSNEVVCDIFGSIVLLFSIHQVTLT